MKNIKLFIKSPMNLIITITCIIISTYFLIFIVKELKPKSQLDKRMSCLELPTYEGVMGCLTLHKQNQE